MKNNKNIINFIIKRKYEVLLISLILHLYISVVFLNLDFYTKIIWPINMLLLGLASIGIFNEKNKRSKTIKNILLLLATILPISYPFFRDNYYYMPILSIIYCLFFSYIFYEILKYLIKPSYINSDIISAAACGAFLLLEVMTFLLQALFYLNNSSIKNIDTTSAAHTYIDLVYLSSITITTIGFGDITPNTPQLKLIVSLFGIFGQFYSVILIGILISKFVAQQEQK